MHSSDLKTQVAVITVASMTAGLGSLIGSITIIIMIFLSSQKLSNPFRRIIFGISFFDCIQSLSHAFVIFKTNPYKSTWFALGNKFSCKGLVFFQLAGHNGALLYTLAINIFYICLIKYNMRRDTYVLRVEPFLHGIPIIWALIAGLVVLVTGHINPSNVPTHECYIAPYPAICLYNPDIECVRGKKALILRLIFFLGPIFVTFVGVLSTYAVLWRTVKTQETRMKKYSWIARRRSLRNHDIMEVQQNPRASTSSQDNVEHASKIPFLRLIVKRRNRSDIENHNHISDRNTVGGATNTQTSPSIQALCRFPARRSLRRRRKSRQFLIQAKWYSLAFFLTYFFFIVFSILTLAGLKNNLFPLFAIARLFNSLHGLLNILVFTRPHVKKVRSQNPSLSWWDAFKKVIRSGGDDGDERTNRLR
jgi:hypothetical protein